MPGMELGEAAPPKPRRGRPRSVGLAERRRAELVDAAYLVFAEQGYERASVSDIAKSAGIGQGTLYRYVEGKRELLDMVFDRCIDRLLSTIDFESVIGAVSTADPDRTEAAVLAVGDRLFPLADEEPELLKLVTVQAGTVDEELRYRIQGLYQTFDSMLGRTLAHARTNGWVGTRTEFPEKETMLLGRLLPALGVPGLVMELDRDTDPARRAEYVRTAVKIASRGILSDAARVAHS